MGRGEASCRETFAPPPTSMYAAYHVVTAPKEMLLALETGHFTVPEQDARVDRWIAEQVEKAPAR